MQTGGGKSNQEEYSFKRYRTTYSEGKFVKGWIMFVNGAVRWANEWEKNGDARGVRWTARGKKGDDYFYGTELNQRMFVNDSEILKPMKGQ